MNRRWILAIIVACPVMALAQTAPPKPSASSGNTQPYQPAVPAPTTSVYGGSGWAGYSGASTAAGSAMSGMSQVISSAGQYNLSTSAAAVNMTQAQRNEIQNRQLAANTYFEMRATNKAARAAEAGPKPTMEQLARIAQQGAPKPLGPNQFDPVTGQLRWPYALQEPSFAPERSAVEQLFVKFATYGGLAYADQTKVRQAINAMFTALKAQIREIPATNYLACRHFLNDLLYAITNTQL